MDAKFSSFNSEGEPVPHDYGDVWQEERTSAGPRLVVGPSSRRVELMRALAVSLEEPYWLLYVLVVSRTSHHEEARYQSSEPIGRGELEDFLDEYSEYLEGDGRHHLWVASPSETSTVILDNHDVLYLYGELDTFKSVLREHGLKEGTVTIPVPHRHTYNSELDDWEDRIMAALSWKSSPLQPVDGQRTSAGPETPPN
jgi:hypothetical protein